MAKQDQQEQKKIDISQGKILDKIYVYFRYQLQQVEKAAKDYKKDKVDRQDGQKLAHIKSQKEYLQKQIKIYDPKTEVGRGRCHGISLLLLTAEMIRARRELAKLQDKDEKKENKIGWPRDIHDFARIENYFRRIAAWDESEASLKKAGQGQEPSLDDVFRQVITWLEQFHASSAKLSLAEKLKELVFDLENPNFGTSAQALSHRQIEVSSQSDGLLQVEKFSSMTVLADDKKCLQRIANLLDKNAYMEIIINGTSTSTGEMTAEWHGIAVFKRGGLYCIMDPNQRGLCYEFSTKEEFMRKLARMVNYKGKYPDAWLTVNAFYLAKDHLDAPKNLMEIRADFAAWRAEEYQQIATAKKLLPQWGKQLYEERDMETLAFFWQQLCKDKSVSFNELCDDELDLSLGSHGCDRLKFDLLVWAAQEKSRLGMETAQRILTDDFSYDWRTVRDTDGNSLLGLAAKHNHVEICAVFLDCLKQLGNEKQNKYLTATNHRGETILHLAARYLSSDMVRLISNRPEFKKISINQPDGFGLTPLMSLLTHQGSHPHAAYVAQQLIDMGANISCRVEKKGAPVNGHTVLRMAIQAGNIAVVELLLKKGARPSPQELHIAVQQRDAKIIESLLKTGISLHPQDEIGLAALASAVATNNRKLAEQIVRAGVGTQADLCMAAKHGRTEIVAMFLAEGIQPEKREGKEKMEAKDAPDTPFRLALKQGHKKTAELLIQTEPKPALHPTDIISAVTMGSSLIVDEIIKNGCDVGSIRLERGRTLLHIAAMAGYMGSVGEQLIAAGVDPAVKDKDGDGYTAAHYAKNNPLTAKEGKKDKVEVKEIKPQRRNSCGFWSRPSQPKPEVRSVPVAGMVPPGSAAIPRSRSGSTF